MRLDYCCNSYIVNNDNDLIWIARLRGTQDVYIRANPFPWETIAMQSYVRAKYVKLTSCVKSLIRTPTSKYSHSWSFIFIFYEVLFFFFIFSLLFVLTLESWYIHKENVHVSIVTSETRLFWRNRTIDWIILGIFQRVDKIYIWIIIPRWYFII